MLLVVSLRRAAAPRWSPFVFVLGGLAAMGLNACFLTLTPAVLPDGQFTATNVRQAWLGGFVEAAIPEEAAKGLVILALMFGLRRYGIRHGAWIGGLVGLGFSLFENLGYILIEPDTRLMAVLSHGAWGIILGRILQWAVMESRPSLTKLLLAFVPTILLHGLVDTAIFLGEVHESKYGVDLAGDEIPPGIIVAMIVEMTAVAALGLFELIWATMIVLRLRRSTAADRRSDTSSDEIAVS